MKGLAEDLRARKLSYSDVYPEWKGRGRWRLVAKNYARKTVRL